MKILAWAGLAVLSTGMGLWLLREGVARAAERETMRAARRWYK